MKHFGIPILLPILLTILACGESSWPPRPVIFPETDAGKNHIVDSLLQAKGWNRTEIQLYLRAFKKEKILEVWGKTKEANAFQKIATHPFCKSSGTIGPKRKEGDRQIPEGFYYINHFNTKSNFFLSLGLNYPNQSDQILGNQQAPGSDIYIHGGCMTVGCIPITNSKILEVFLLASQAQANGQSRVPVHIFPAKMEGIQWTSMVAKHPKHQSFWQQLQAVYQHFESTRQVPEILIDADGTYSIKNRF